MKITFTGAQSTGKTTLLHELQKLPQFKDYEVCDNLTRRILQLADRQEVPEEAREEFIQNKIIDLHIENLQKENILSDRCVVDCYVYATMQCGEGKIGSSTYLRALDTLYDYIDNYDYIFYLEPEFGVVPDGVRSSSVEEQAFVADIFRSIIEVLQETLGKTNIYKLSGSKEGRIEQMKEILL